MDKKIALLSLFALSTVSLVTAAVVGSSYLESSASPFIFRSGAHICNGNHYLERSATEALPGCKEYWVCCNCHTHYLSSEDLPEGSIWADKGIATEIVGEYDDRYLSYNPEPTPGGDGDFMLGYLKRICDSAFEYDQMGYTTKQINSVGYIEGDENYFVVNVLTNEDDTSIDIYMYYWDVEASSYEEFLEIIKEDKEYTLIENFGCGSTINDPATDEYDLRDDNYFKEYYPGYTFRGPTIYVPETSYYFTGVGKKDDAYTSNLAFIKYLDGTYRILFEHTETDTSTNMYQLMESVYNHLDDSPSIEPETRLSSLKNSLKTLAETGLNEKFPNYTFNELETISYYYAPPTYDDEGNIEWDAYEYFNIYYTTIEGEDTLFLCSVDSVSPCGDIDTMLNTVIDNPENFICSWTAKIKDNNSDHKMSETALFSELFPGEVKGRDVIGWEDYVFSDQTIVDGKYAIVHSQIYYQYLGLMYDESLDTYKFIDTLENAEDDYDQSCCASTGDASSLSYELADDLFNVKHHYHTHNVKHYLARNATSIRGGCIDHYACDECNKWWLNEASLPSSVEPYTEGVCNLDFEEDDVRYVDYSNPKTEIDWIIEKLKDYLANDDVTPIDITNLTYIPIEDKGLCIYVTYPCYEKMCGVEKQIIVYGVNDIDTFLEALLTEPYTSSSSSYSTPDNTSNWKLDASNKAQLKTAFPGQHVGYTLRLNDDYYSYGGVNYYEGTYTSIYQYRTHEFTDVQSAIEDVISSSTNDPNSIYYMLLDQLFHDGVNDDPVTDSYVHYSYLASTSTQSGNLEYWKFADSDRFTFNRPENATIVEGTSTLGMITDSTDPRYIKPGEEPNLKQLFYANGIGLGGNNFTLVDVSDPNDSNRTYFANDTSYREEGDTITVMTLNPLEEGIIKQYSGEVGGELVLNKTYNVPGATTLDLHTYLRLITSTEESPLSYLSRFVQSNVTINDHVYSMHQLSPAKLDKEIFASTHDLIEDTHPTNSSNECNFSIYDIEVRFDENYKIEGFSFISPKLEYVSNPSSSNYGKVTYNYNDAYKITFSFDLENVRTTVINL